MATAASFARLVVQDFHGSFKHPGNGPEERILSRHRNSTLGVLHKVHLLFALRVCQLTGSHLIRLCNFQSAFQCVVNPPSRSSFPRYSSSAYIPIVAARLTHLQKLPPASPPWLVHQSPSPPSPLVDAKCCIKRLV